MERADKRGLKLILGATRANIERNILQPMRDIYGDSIATGINSQNNAKICGEKVYCIGADNVRQVAKIRGSEIAYCAIDEATDINKEVFEMLKSRLSLPWSCCDITTNPASPNHWFKGFLDSAEQGVDIYCQDYTIYDNPFLPEEYVHALEAEYAGSVWFDRYILGKWTLAEGLIFANYMKALVDEAPAEPQEYALSLDYGTSNPFAVMLWERQGNVWYGSKELYYSGRDTGVQKTDDEYLSMLENLIEPIKPLLIKKGRDMWGNCVERVEPIPVIIDPSAASFIALLRQSKWFRVIEADNSVIDGIRNTSTAIERGLIKILKSCKNWQDEAQSYVWDEDAVEDRPIKENDHLMDSTRYFVQTMRLVRPYDNYIPIFERR
jgi:PBSX family phage terminase large subunit